MTTLILAAVAAFSFGDIEVGCEERGDWKVSLSREVADDGAEIAKITLESPEAAVPPKTCGLLTMRRLHAKFTNHPCR